MKKNVQEVLSRLLAENDDAPAPDLDSNDLVDPGAGPELGDEGEPEAITNESGTISFVPSEDSDPGLEVISFLKAVKEACPDCWGAISEAVANGLEDEEGAPGEGPIPGPEGDEIPDAPGLD